MVSIGVQSEDPVEYHAFRQISFYEGFLAFTNIMFGFSTSSLRPFADSGLTLNFQLSMLPSLVLSRKRKAQSSSPSLSPCFKSQILSCILLQVL